jgi:hypothetical protein
MKVLPKILTFQKRFFPFFEKVAAFFILVVLFLKTIGLSGVIDQYFGTNVLILVMLSTILLITLDSSSRIIIIDEFISSPDLQIKKLSDAIIDVINKYQNISILRVFALTTGSIEPIIESSKVPSINSVNILLYSAKEDKNFTDQKRADMLENQCILMIKNWRRLSKNHKCNISIQKYNFQPMEYFIIFDNYVLIQGVYMFEENPETIGIIAQSPLIISNKTQNGRELIEQRILVFDALFKAYPNVW